MFPYIDSLPRVRFSQTTEGVAEGRGGGPRRAGKSDRGEPQQIVGTHRNTRCGKILKNNSIERLNKPILIIRTFLSIVAAGNYRTLRQSRCIIEIEEAAMTGSKIFTPFYDVKTKTMGKSGAFFLEYLLKARTDLHMESGSHACDEELNVYIAGLLSSLIRSDSFLRQKPYISPFDADVKQWLEAHSGLRNAFTVYRDNADFGLLLIGLFTGYKHEGSYHKIVMAGHNDQGRIAIYYRLAASALMHLHGKYGSLIDVFDTLAEHLDEFIRILQYMSYRYFDLIERISEGSFFHLEREIEAMEKKKQYDIKLDEFLKLYAIYKEKPSDELKKRLITLADELKKVNSDFTIDGKL